MSRFFSTRHSRLDAYTPGEQINSSWLIKLNTNESPFPPTARTNEYVARAADKANLYPELSSGRLRELLSEIYDVEPDNIFISNSSDEALDCSFLAFFDENNPVSFPDITYGFYPVFAELYGIPYNTVPLRDDFTIDYRDYLSIPGSVVIANPNAPTGIAMKRDEIEQIIRSNPDRIVLIDEAYIDFGGESCVPLTKKYDNLIVTQTFSKSRSLAGARLGFAIASKEIILDLETIRYSTNPYNVNRLSVAAGTAALEDNEIYMQRCRQIIATRERITHELCAMGFEILPSSCNFVFARNAAMGGKELYLELRRRNILVRHFDQPRISDFLRITIGTDSQMDTLIAAVKEILTEAKQ